MQQTHPATTEHLPPGWIKCATTDGRVYYQNNATKSTQWSPPIPQIPQTILVVQPNEFTQIPQIQTPQIQKHTNTNANELIQKQNLELQIIAQQKQNLELQIAQHISDQNKKKWKQKSKSKSRSSSIVGDHNLTKRSCVETFWLVSGILLAIVSMIFDIYEMIDGGASTAGAIMFIISLCCLVVGVIEYKTGDCECLRDGLMVITFNYSEKKKNAKAKRKGCCQGRHRYNEYEKQSIRLLNVLNAIFWLVLLGWDFYDQYVGISESDDFMYTLIKVGVAVLGVAVSCISCFFYTAIGKWICKTICTMAAIGVIVMVIYGNASSGDEPN